MLEAKHAFRAAAPLPASNRDNATDRNEVGLNDFKSMFPTWLRTPDPLSPYSRHRSIVQGEGGLGCIERRCRMGRTTLLYSALTYLKDLNKLWNQGITENMGVPPSHRGREGGPNRVSEPPPLGRVSPYTVAPSIPQAFYRQSLAESTVAPPLRYRGGAPSLPCSGTKRCRAWSQRSTGKSCFSHLMPKGWSIRLRDSKRECN